MEWTACLVWRWRYHWNHRIGIIELDRGSDVVVWIFHQYSHTSTHFRSRSGLVRCSSLSVVIALRVSTILPFCASFVIGQKKIEYHDGMDCVCSMTLTISLESSNWNHRIGQRWWCGSLNFPSIFTHVHTFSQPQRFGSMLITFRCNCIASVHYFAILCSICNWYEPTASPFFPTTTTLKSQATVRLNLSQTNPDLHRNVLFQLGTRTAQHFWICLALSSMDSPIILNWLPPGLEYTS